MILKTAIRRPLLGLDIDRKLKSMEIATPMIDKGDLFVWELTEPLTEEKLAQRLKRVANNEKPMKPPKGWPMFCNMAEKLETAEEAKKAQTIFIDSGTLLGAHLLRSILWEDPKGTATMSPREWAYYLMMWQEVMTEFLDFCRSNDKDFMITVHQKIGEIPTKDNKVIKTKGEGGVINREYIGAMSLKIVPSIQGQFANEIGMMVEEMYGLDVVMDGDKPRWVCRVLPDGRRDLRTSYNVKEAEFAPDFAKIWR
jgi:hypothetical protein